MPFFNYVLNLPNPPNTPSQDVNSMQANTNAINNIINVDHFPFNVANGGFHKQVHLFNQAAPGLAGADADLFANAVAGQSLPFWENGAGGSPFQIALIKNSNLIANGNINLGGLLIQWGTNTVASGNPTAFPIPFPTAVFSIQTTIFQNTTNRHFVYVRSNTLAQFITTQLDANGSGETSTFSWIAIGN